MPILVSRNSFIDFGNDMLLSFWYVETLARGQVNAAHFTNVSIKESYRAAA